MFRTLSVVMVASCLLAAQAAGAAARQTPSAASSQAPAPVQKQAPPTPQAQVRSLFQSGQDQQVIAAVNGSTAQGANLAPLLFVAAQSHERLQQARQARDVYARLAAYPQDSPWRALGESGVRIADRKFPEAVTAANRAVTLAPSLAEAHYGLGRALAYTKDFARSGASFEQAGRIDPNMAYAYYYAGMSYYQAKRVDLMARNFETFLRLAPNAPERARVQSIMRSIRG